MRLLFWAKSATDGRHGASLVGEIEGTLADARHLDGFGTMADESTPPLPNGAVRVAQGHGVSAIDKAGRTRAVLYFD